MALTRKSLELKCCSRWEKNYHVTSKDSRTLCIRTFLFDNKYLSGNYFDKILIRYFLPISNPYTKKSRYIIWITVRGSKTRPPSVRPRLVQNACACTVFEKCCFARQHACARVCTRCFWKLWVFSKKNYFYFVVVIVCLKQYKGELDLELFSQ